MVNFERHFKYGPKNFEKFKSTARKKAFQNRSKLTWENQTKGESMSINIGGGELKELKPRILVMGVGWSRRKCS